VYLLYWPCTWSIALGSLPGNVPLGASLQAAGLFLAGAGLMRGAGCTINDLWDKDVDRQVATVFVITYPLAKRYTNYPQIFLGATFNWGALLGYSAVQGTIDPAVCGPLYLGALAWTVVYDTIYAHQDKEDDARIGMKSTALTFGAHTKPLLSGTLAASAACLAGVGHAAALGWPYYAALAAAVTRAGHQVR
ncbi:4-hydroxybenzoate polyprenyltransferase, mitochondrial, partial [Ostrinia furnacalis]|uniref:4-hydroxybenzoate polyprenyltransferase, mitochondrial n=1 Tax=Ostrinia furnacalis TaxID=93504 RepID=UPI00103DF858